nr:hypothetical protein [uncultured Desulfobacter sp.]
MKNLAAQTAQATKDIKEKIAGIQSSTEHTVLDVTKIADVIADVNEIVTAIAAAVEEQSASATDVAQNIEQASTGIGEVNENVVQSSQVSSEIAKDISDVNSVAKEMTRRSVQVNQSAVELSGLSSKLRDMISVFKVSVKDAHYDTTSGILENDIPTFGLTGNHRSACWPAKNTDDEKILYYCFIDLPGFRDICFKFFWTSTTYQDGPVPASDAAYVSFGRTMGQIRQRIMDVHGPAPEKNAILKCNAINGSVTFLVCCGPRISCHNNTL